MGGVPRPAPARRARTRRRRAHREARRRRYRRRRAQAHRPPGRRRAGLAPLLHAAGRRLHPRHPQGARGGRLGRAHAGGGAPDRRLVRALTEAPLTRIVPRPGEERIRRLGLKRRPFRDLYHRALDLRWRIFLLVAAGAYLGGNIVFAALYLLQPGAIDKARPGSVADAFFFSVQTMATIGYGTMSPATTYANLVMTAETLFGMILLAMVTGLVFARFSRPTARVLFSNVAVIAPFDGQRMLVVRIGNERANQIVQAEVQFTLLRDEITREGERFRRMVDLPLQRHRTPVFALTFSAMHALDGASPIAGITPERLARERMELLVSVTGLDETVSQTVQACWSYLPHEIRFGHRFVDIFGRAANGRRAIDFGRFHETEMIAETENGEPVDPPFSRSAMD
jgi:inward rectifier potassium channel